MRTLYLCGPINGCTDAAAKDWRAWVKDAWSGACIDPMDRDYRGRETEAFREIVEFDKADIDRADALLVNFDKPSVGTSMEVLYAWASDKTVVVVCRPETVISPWLRYHADYIVHSWEEALAEAADAPAAQRDFHSEADAALVSRINGLEAIKRDYWERFDEARASAVPGQGTDGEPCAHLCIGLSFWTGRKVSTCLDCGTAIDVPSVMTSPARDDARGLAPRTEPVFALREACLRMADDFQTSDSHHPEHILVRREHFEAMRAVLEPMTSPARDDAQVGRERLADLIRSEFIGVEPDSQGVVLEDDDWRVIVQALTAVMAQPDRPRR